MGIQLVIDNPGISEFNLVTADAPALTSDPGAGGWQVTAAGDRIDVSHQTTTGHDLSEVLSLVAVNAQLYLRTQGETRTYRVVGVSSNAGWHTFTVDPAGTKSSTSFALTAGAPYSLALYNPSTDGQPGPQGPVGPAGPAGADGADGADGLDGTPGVGQLQLTSFTAATTSDPGAGNWQTLLANTRVDVSDTTQEGAPIRNILLSLVSGDRLYLRVADSVRIYVVQSVTARTGYVEIATSAVEDGGGFVLQLNDVHSLLPVYSAAAGSGDVLAPPSTTDNAIARWDSVAKTLQNSAASVNDTGGITADSLDATAGSGSVSALVVQAQSRLEAWAEYRQFQIAAPATGPTTGRNLYWTRNTNGGDPMFDKDTGIVRRVVLDDMLGAGVGSYNFGGVSTGSEAAAGTFRASDSTPAATTSLRFDPASAEGRALSAILSALKQNDRVILASVLDPSNHFIGTLGAAPTVDGGGDIILTVTGTGSGSWAGRYTLTVFQSAAALIANLNDLGDVNVANAGPATDQWSLVWDDLSGTFLLADISGGTGGTPSSTVTTSDAAAGAAGDATTYSRGNHKHQVATGTPEALAVGEVNAAGTAPELTRRDHKHALPGLAQPATPGPETDGFFRGSDQTKLDGVEAGATADQTGAEIKAAYEAEADTNAFTDAEKTKLAGAEEVSNKDQPNGYAGLDGSGKIASSALPLGALDYKGGWNAATNTPNLNVPYSGDAGDTYSVTTPGTRDLLDGNGSRVFASGDRLLYDGSAWIHEENTDEVGAAGDSHVTDDGLSHSQVQANQTAITGLQATAPTANQKAALAGTNGAPAAGNPYVTNSDPRNTDARTPTAHQHDAADINSGTLAFARLPVGTGATQVAQGDHGHTPAQVGLGNVDNTSDAQKAASGPIADALAARELAANKNQNNGYAGLDAGGKIAASQLPADLLEFKGGWNAATNTPDLTVATYGQPTPADLTGNRYRVTVLGTRDLGDGSRDYKVGDWLMWDGSTWVYTPSTAQSGGQVDSIVEGSLIGVDATDPINPTVSVKGNPSGNAGVLLYGPSGTPLIAEGPTADLPLVSKGNGAAPAFEKVKMGSGVADFAVADLQNRIQNDRLLTRLGVNPLSQAGSYEIAEQTAVSLPDDHFLFEDANAGGAGVGLFRRIKAQDVNIPARRIYQASGNHISFPAGAPTAGQIPYFINPTLMGYKTENEGGFPPPDLGMWEFSTAGILTAIGDFTITDGAGASVTNPTLAQRIYLHTLTDAAAAQKDWTNVFSEFATGTLFLLYNETAGSKVPYVFKVTGGVQTQGSLRWWTCSYVNVDAAGPQASLVVGQDFRVFVLPQKAQAPSGGRYLVQSYHEWVSGASANAYYTFNAAQGHKAHAFDQAITAQTYPFGYRGPILPVAGTLQKVRIEGWVQSTATRTLALYIDKVTPNGASAPTDVNCGGFQFNSSVFQTANTYGVWEIDVSSDPDSVFAAGDQLGISLAESIAGANTFQISISAEWTL